MPKQAPAVEVEFTRVDSSNVHSVSFIATHVDVSDDTFTDRGTLCVRFLHAPTTVYMYPGVDERTYSAMLEPDASVGRLVNGVKAEVPALKLEL